MPSFFYFRLILGFIGLIIIIYSIMVFGGLVIDMYSDGSGPFTDDPSMVIPLALLIFGISFISIISFKMYSKLKRTKFSK